MQARKNNEAHGAGTIAHEDVGGVVLTMAEHFREERQPRPHPRPPPTPVPEQADCCVILTCVECESPPEEHTESREYSQTTPIDWSRSWGSICEESDSDSDCEYETLFDVENEAKAFADYDCETFYEVGDITDGMDDLMDPMFAQVEFEWDIQETQSDSMKSNEVHTVSGALVRLAKQDSAKNVRDTYAQKATAMTRKPLSPCIGSMTHRLSVKHQGLNTKQKGPQRLKEHDPELRVNLSSHYHEHTEQQVKHKPTDRSINQIQQLLERIDQTQQLLEKQIARELEIDTLKQLGAFVAVETSESKQQGEESHDTIENTINRNNDTTNRTEEDATERTEEEDTTRNGEAPSEEPSEEHTRGPPEEESRGPPEEESHGQPEEESHGPPKEETHGPPEERTEENIELPEQEASHERGLSEQELSFDPPEQDPPKQPNDESWHELEQHALQLDATGAYYQTTTKQAFDYFQEEGFVERIDEGIVVFYQ